MSIKNLFPKGLQTGNKTSVIIDETAYLPLESYMYQPQVSLNEMVTVTAMRDLFCQVENEKKERSTVQTAEKEKESKVVNPEDIRIEERQGAIYIIVENHEPQLLFGASIQLVTEEHVVMLDGSIQRNISICVQDQRGITNCFPVPFFLYGQKCFNLVQHHCPYVRFMEWIPKAQAYMRSYMNQLLQVTWPLPISRKYGFSGWIHEGKNWQYLHGGMDNVHSSRCLPTNFDATIAFRCFWPIGNHLLKKGKEGANMLIFLHSHLGYIARLMQQGGFSMHHILFLSGKSGAGKSSLLQELSGEIFYDQSFKTKMDATQSFIEGRIQEMRDSLFLVDDVHPAPTRNMGDNLMNNVETVIRAYSDGVLRGKRGTNNELEEVEVCGAVWMTGEYYKLTSYSSYLRTIEIQLPHDSINWDNVTLLQQDNTIARNYYAGYIQYMEAHADEWIQYFKNHVTPIRRKWYTILVSDGSRTVDTAVAFVFAIQTIAGYGKSVGMPCIQMDAWTDQAEKYVQKYLTTKMNNDRHADPIELFRHTVKLLYDAGMLKIAANKESFRANTTYEGYFDRNSMIVIKEIVVEKVKGYCFKQGIAYIIPTTMELFQAGVLRCPEAERFTVRRNNQNRPTMIRIAIDALNKGETTPIITEESQDEYFKNNNV